MSIAWNTSTEPQFRTIEGLRIRYAESEQSDGHALLLASPWPPSAHAAVEGGTVGKVLVNVRDA